MTLHSQERVTTFEQNYTDDLLRRLEAQLIDEHPDGLMPRDAHPKMHGLVQAEFVIHADIPGVKPEEIDISMEDGVLTIRGEKKSEAKTEKEGYKRVERTYGSFYRRFSLPDTANADAISAASKHGVLEVVIPKREAVQPKKISVTAVQ